MCKPNENGFAYLGKDPSISLDEYAHQCSVLRKMWLVFPFIKKSKFVEFQTIKLLDGVVYETRLRKAGG